MLETFINIIKNHFQTLKDPRKGNNTTYKFSDVCMAAYSVFHMQSESLVKPLLANITHQHSRVRKDIIDCLCETEVNDTSVFITTFQIVKFRNLFNTQQ